MAKLVLDDFYDFDFILIGISCHAKDYKLAWAINKELGWDFERIEDLELQNKNEEAYFSFYAFEQEEDFRSYYLISNRSNKGFLVPERKEIDYFLELKGEFEEERIDRIKNRIKEINVVLMSFEIDPQELKSRNNLLI